LIIPSIPAEAAIVNAHREPPKSETGQIFSVPIQAAVLTAFLMQVIIYPVFSGSFCP
jgi:hypothetical protein